jgi:hypothetical protein
MDLMKQKMENVKNGLVDTLETALFQAAGGITTGIDGLDHLVQEAPSGASVVGNVAQDTYSWWRNQFKDMAGLSFASVGRKNMVTMNNNCGQNRTSDFPDIIVTTQAVYEFYEAEMDDYLRMDSTLLGDSGFQNVAFKGKPIVWSPSCKAQSMYFLNTNFLKLQYDPRYFFSITDWKSIPNQVNDRAAQIILACALTTNRRRCHGVMFNIDTA